MNLSGEASALNNLGGTYNAFGETSRALDPFQRALAIHRQTGNRKGEATTLNNLGTACSRLGDGKRALELYKQALLTFRAVRDAKGAATAMKNIQSLYADRRYRSSLGEIPGNLSDSLAP